MRMHLVLGGAIAGLLAVAQTARPRCAELNETAVSAALGNRPEQVESEVSAAVSRGDSVCAGVVLGNIATVMSTHGRIGESEEFARRSVDLLQTLLDPGNPILLRPLHVLAITRLEQHKFRLAERAFQQMLRVQTERPEERGQVHITRAILLQIEGKFEEAESEYVRAYDEWTKLGRAANVDTAAVLNYLGVLYMTEGRFREASQVLDRALVIVDTAEDAVPLDRIKLLNARASAHAKMREWPQAQEKLRQAIAAAERAGVSEPFVLRPVLNNLAFVLRKNHQRREARTMEKRATALPANPPSVIDIQELSAMTRAGRH